MLTPRLCISLLCFLYWCVRYILGSTCFFGVLADLGGDDGLLFNCIVFVFVLAILLVNGRGLWDFEIVWWVSNEERYLRFWSLIWFYFYGRYGRSVQRFCFGIVVTCYVHITPIYFNFSLCFFLLLMLSQSAIYLNLFYQI